MQVDLPDVVAEVSAQFALITSPGHAAAVDAFLDARTDPGRSSLPINP